MAYTFKQNMVSSSKYSIKCPYSMTPQYITIHNTSNNASAENEVKYMISNNNQTSYHVAVDDKYVIQAIPFNRNAWHAGDGASGTGNRKSIGIEICYSTGNVETFKKAEANCAKYVATLLKQYGWNTSRVKRHKDWSGKNCPHKTMELGWDRFVKMIQAELDILNGKTTAAKPTTSTTTSTTFKVGNYKKYVVTTDALNVRRTRNATSQVLTTIPKGTKIYVGYVMYQDNSTTPKGDLWGGVTYNNATGFINLKYVKPYVEPTTGTSKTVNYRVRITADSLNVRKEPNATAKVATTVAKGNVFTIVEEKNGWGKLKSGAGWINLSYTTKL
ncbi:MAG: N-acetylmuramoyl-L-alanine amidase [Clostridia bacterium]|nr:N-acetylmuramoyl-L-alanine amidase [Clostridia bacterium]